MTMTNPMRDGHGKGRGQPHVELAWKDQKPSNPDATAENLASRRARGRPFQRGNTAAVGRVPNVALLGVDASQIPELTRKDIRKAERLRRRRCSETAATTGYVSAGSSAIHGSAALAHVASRRVYALAFAADDPALYKLAADLSDRHAQLEIKARWLAKDEAASRPDVDDVERERARAEFQRRLGHGSGQ
jgi:hypothetical protein